MTDWRHRRKLRLVALAAAVACAASACGQSGPLFLPDRAAPQSAQATAGDENTAEADADETTDDEAGQ